jgi:SAM-dependent methyltransferase
VAVFDARRRFSATAPDYARHRPSYPPALIDWILAGARLPAAARVADLGCGTGISARLFAARGLRVVGIDPNPMMLERAVAAGGGPAYVRAEAAATGLVDGSVGLVIAAQAFHWFELAPTLAEIGRILAPGGRCAAFWNLRAPGGFNDAYEALLHAWSPEYRELAKGPDTIAALRASPPVAEAEQAEFTHEQPLDLEGFLGRVRSSSYVAHGVADRAGFERELRALFAREQRGGVLALRYVARALLFRVADPG